VQELLAQLSIPDSHASQILGGFVHLIQARTRCRAFHPSARQRVVLANPAVYSVLRKTRAGGEIVLALTNVTSSAQELLLPLVDLGEVDSTWRDVLTERAIRAVDGVLRVPLDAYEIIWLEPLRA
jgi:sucrose phosphorylase